MADSLNHAHPSFYDLTHDYDMLVFRGISSTTDTHEFLTRPTCFYFFDRVLVTIRVADSVSTPTVLVRMLNKTGRTPKRATGLMHAILAKMVNGFLSLRKPLLEQLDTWRRDLLDSNNPFDDWMAVMQHNSYPRRLAMLCDEQHDAVIA